MKCRVIVFNKDGWVVVDREFQFKYEAHSFIRDEVVRARNEYDNYEILTVEKGLRKCRILDYCRVCVVCAPGETMGRAYRIHFIINCWKSRPRGGATPNVKEFMKPRLIKMPSGSFRNISAIR